MKRLSLFGIILFSTSGFAAENPCYNGNSEVKIAMHGGIGEKYYAEDIKIQRKAAFKSALEEARRDLLDGVSALDVVESAISKLEDAGVFNTGKGAEANVIGQVTLDSSIMDGKDRSIGSIANFKTVKNPISAAKMAMKAGNRLFVGPDAEDFAKELVRVQPSYFINTKKKVSSLDHPAKQTGTVGAIVIDRCGNMAAGTSTGGYNSKPVGRVGDSPIIGAATYAENGLCAVSTTGQGEFFIRASIAHEVCAQLRYTKKNVRTVANDVIEKNIGKLNAVGGLIVLDKAGNFASSFVTPEDGLLRGSADRTEVRLSVFQEVERVPQSTKK